MRQFLGVILALVIAFATPAWASANASDTQENRGQTIAALDWKAGPAPYPVTGHASIMLPANAMYLDAANTSKLLELTGNLPEADSYTIAPKDFSWFAIIQFDEAGYVKDKETIDPDALLKTMRDNQAEANTQRAEQKLDPLTLNGWAVVPHYDTATHNLEYGINLSSPDGASVNYATKMLGRRGVMVATLLTSGTGLQSDLVAFRKMMAGFAYKPDETYAAYKDGDKVAEYGLAALVTGGAAAAALKTGLFAGLLKGLLVFWKLIAVGVVAFFAAIRGFFARLFGGGKDLGPPPGDDTV